MYSSFLRSRLFGVEPLAPQHLPILVDLDLVQCRIDLETEAMPLRIRAPLIDELLHCFDAFVIVERISDFKRRFDGIVFLRRQDHTGAQFRLRQLVALVPRTNYDSYFCHGDSLFSYYLSARLCSARADNSSLVRLANFCACSKNESSFPHSLINAFFKAGSFCAIRHSAAHISSPS